MPSSDAVRAGPASAASIPSPAIFTPPPAVQCRQPGSSLRWARPMSCATAIARAASTISAEARAGSSGPSESMSSSDSADTHSSTT